MKEYHVKKKSQEKNLKIAKFSIDSTFSDFDNLSKLSFCAARLYNSALYELRQYFFVNAKYLNYVQNYHKVKDSENYKLLLTDIGQLVIRSVDRDMKSFFALLKLKQNGRYSEKVSLPNYKDKDKGITFAIHGRSVKVKNGKVSFGLTKEFVEKFGLSKNRIEFNIPKYIQHIKTFQQIRIVSRYGGKSFDIEFVYDSPKEMKNLDKNSILSIDLGMDNFATLYSPGSKSEIINGKRLKSVNQYFNKQKTKLQADYNSPKIPDTNTKRFIRLSQGRKNRINDILNKSANHIIKKCLNENLGTLVIGDFSEAKQEINLGRVTNQNFVSIPYYLFKQKLESKCKHYGISYVLQEESYTSKCSSYDLESVEKHENYQGKRIKRGLFRTKDGKLINADLNGAINIYRKYLKSNSKKDLSFNEVRAAVTPPVKVNL